MHPKNTGIHRRIEQQNGARRSEGNLQQARPSRHPSFGPLDFRGADHPDNDEREP
jgi:hypothetical protein